MNVKHSSALAFIAAIALLSLPADAAVLSAQGTVRYLSIVDSDTDPSAFGNYFAVNGVTSLGTCSLSQGHVVFRLRDGDRGDAMRSVVTAALLSGKEVIVSIDDVNLVTNGACIARSIRLLP